MIRRAVAVVAATVGGLTILAGPGFAGPAPTPALEELWSEFPLESPEQAPALRQPPPTNPASRVSTRPADSRDDSAAPWILLGLGAAAAAATVSLAYRRRLSTLEPPEQLRKERRASTTHRPARITTSRAPAGNRPSRTVAETPVHIGAVRGSSSFVGVLSPRPRLDEPAEERSAEPAASGLQLCEIRWWRGYLKSQFYVEADPPLESRAFRARGSDGHQPSDEAVAAHAAFVEELVAAGWEPHGSGVHWYSDRFRKI